MFLASNICLSQKQVQKIYHEKLGCSITLEYSSSSYLDSICDVISLDSQRIIFSGFIYSDRVEESKVFFVPELDQEGGEIPLFLFTILENECKTSELDEYPLRLSFSANCVSPAGGSK